MNVVIMAGGGGSRLWPLSRHNKPKQFLDLGSGKTLLEETWERALQLTDQEHIFIATTEECRERIQQFLPQASEERLMIEPERRDTGPAFAAAAVMLVEKGQGDEPTIFMWSDHVFTNEKELIEDLQKVPKLIEQYPTSVVIATHIPVYPETGLGYVQVGDKIEGYEDVFKVESFKEKPDEDTAKKYLEAGNYFWNMAYVSAKPNFLLSQLREHSPEVMEHIDAAIEALKRGDTEGYKDHYGKCDKISIDYILLEKTSDILALTGDYGWSDVGNWKAVHDVFGVSGDHMPKGHHVHVGGEGNYIYNTTEKVVSLLGVKDVIVVVTEDAILVTNKDSAHKVKDVVSQLEKDQKDQYL